MRLSLFILLLAISMSTIADEILKFNYDRVASACSGISSMQKAAGHYIVVLSLTVLEKQMIIEQLTLNIFTQ